MEPLNTTATRAIPMLLAGQPTTDAKVGFAWQIAAGTTLGRAATASWSNDGVLHVRARTAAWSLEMRRARPMLLERLRHLLGPDVVRRLVIDSDEAPHPRSML
jgi:hypothetical protein